MTELETAAAGIGHNNPPEPTPYEMSRQEIEDLCMEAKNWLDGEPISSQAVADQIDNLKVLLRDAKKRADERRKDEVKPLDDAKSEIQARYNALIGDTKTSGKGVVILAMEACDKVLSPWLQKLDDEKRERERIAREAADAKAREAQEAVRAARELDLAAKEEAEALLRDAKKAEAVVKKVARTGTGMSSHLRRSWKPVLTDATAAARWAWQAKRMEMEDFLLHLAEAEVRSGAREIPGFEVIEERGVA